MLTPRVGNKNMSTVTIFHLRPPFNEGNKSSGITYVPIILYKYVVSLRNIN